MATEPERPIEKLLRAAAQKRRDEAGGPFEPDPATRRLLQGEVGRQFAGAAPERRPLWSLFGGLWPRLAVGSAILAVLGVVVWLAMPGMRSEKSATMLARNQATPAPVPANESLAEKLKTPAAAGAALAKESPAQPAVVAYADRTQSQLRPSLAEPLPAQKTPATDSLRSQPERLDQQVPAVSTPAPREAEIAASRRSASPEIAGTLSGGAERRLASPTASPPPGNAPAIPAVPTPVAAAASAASPVAEDKSLKLKDAEALAGNRAAVAPVTAGTPIGFQAASFKAQAGPAVSQRYAQVTTGKKAKLPRPELTSFQVEQSGSERRIVDGDGSVYKGYIAASDSMARSRAADYGAVPAPAARARPRAQMLLPLGTKPTDRYYRTTSSVYPARISACKASRSPEPAARRPHEHTRPYEHQPGSLKSAASLQTSSGEVHALPLSSTRISGKVMVGNGKAVDIKAEPASR